MAPSGRAQSPTFSWPIPKPLLTDGKINQGRLGPPGSLAWVDPLAPGPTQGFRADPPLPSLWCQLSHPQLFLHKGVTSLKCKCESGIFQCFLRSGFQTPHPSTKPYQLCPPSLASFLYTPCPQVEATQALFFLLQNAKLPSAPGPLPGSSRYSAG